MLPGQNEIIFGNAYLTALNMAAVFAYDFVRHIKVLC